MNSIAEGTTSGGEIPGAVAEARHFTHHLTELLAREHATMVEFLAALAEFDGRRLWADLGYASLFDFLHRELGMSAGAAFYRKTAAALVQRFPEILEALADGRLCITSIPEVAKVITDENFCEVLPRFFHRSKREAKEVAAAIAPQTAPARRDVITTVRDDPARLVAGVGGSLPLVLDANGATGPNRASAGVESAGVGTDRAEEPARPSVCGRADTRRPPVADNVEPLTANLRRVHMTVSDRWVQKLEALRVALSHSHPAGRAEEITEYALDIALEHVARKKGLLSRKRTRKPAPSAARKRAPPVNPVSEKRPPPRRARAAPQRDPAVDDGAVNGLPPGRHHGPSPRVKPAREDLGPGGAAGPPAEPDARPGPGDPPRQPHIPAEVRRAVTARDEGRCQWKLHDGSLCGSNVRVELDHIHPLALGGASTIENLRLLCERHNQLAARRFFGDGWMDRMIRRPAPPRVTPGLRVPDRAS